MDHSEKARAGPPRSVFAGDPTGGIDKSTRYQNITTELHEPSFGHTLFELSVVKAENKTDLGGLLPDNTMTSLPHLAWGVGTVDTLEHTAVLR